MMIYGHKATKTGHHSLFGTKCSSCGTKDEMEMYTFSRYFHLFWIPVFPYRKEAVTQCNHCKQVLNKKQFSADLLSQYEEMKMNIKTPYWQFIGAGLLAVLIIAITFSVKEDNKRDMAYLAAPKAGDIYEIKLNSSSYTLYKVLDVTPDSVYVLFNKFETTRQSGLNKAEMNEPGSFSEEEGMAIAKKTLLSLKEKGEIESVRR
jgi:zinc-ribbon family